MQESGARSNYLLTLIKFIFALILFCFLAELSKEFWRAISITKDDFSQKGIYLSVLCTFMFYVFVADLNGFYKKIQRFFFRSSFVSFLIPALLIISGLGYFLLPKIINFPFDKNVFVFLGGSVLTAHLSFIARESKGGSFTAFINYLFIFSILCIINLVFFGLYLRLAYNIHMGQIIVDSVKSSIILINNLFSQIF